MTCKVIKIRSRIQNSTYIDGDVWYMFVFLVKRDGCIIRFSLSEPFLKHASDIRYNVPRIHKG